MVQKNILPPTGQIDLNIEEEQLGMFAKKLINELKVEAILSSPDQPDVSKKKIKFDIEMIVPPAKNFIHTTDSGKSSSNVFNKETLDGVARSVRYLLDHIVLPNSWLLLGRTEGESRRLIIITYSFTFKMGAYSFKKSGENYERFNAQLN